MRFRGFVAVKEVSLEVSSRLDHGADRPERRRQDHALQLHLRLPRGVDGQGHRSTASVDGLPAHRRSLRGLVRTFQIPRIFHRLTLVENMLVADPAQPGECILRLLHPSRRHVGASVRRARRRASCSAAQHRQARRRICRHHVGRTAQASRTRPRADDRPEDDPPRRADGGGQSRRSASACSSGSKSYAATGDSPSSSSSTTWRW